MTDDTKLSILQVLLKEKYHCLHVMRHRVQAITLAAVGGFLVAAAWVSRQPSPLGAGHKAFLTVSLSVALGVVLAFLGDMTRGFRSTQRVVVRLERILHCYDKDFFGEGTGTLYPREWMSSGMPDGQGRFFHAVWLLLPLSHLCSLVLLWL